MRIDIKHGWFYSAGRQFGWISSGYDMAGIGINMEVVKRLQSKDEFLEVSVEQVLYRVSVEKALEFIGTWKSVIKYRRNDIGVISRSLLEEIKKLQIPVKKQSPLKILQSTLL